MTHISVAQHLKSVHWSEDITSIKMAPMSDAAAPVTRNTISQFLVEASV